MRWLGAVESIILIVLTIAGILLSVLSTLNVSFIGSDMVPNATLAILSSVTLFLFIQLSRLRKVDDQTRQIEKLNDQLTKLDIDTIAKNMKDEFYGGVITVHSKLPEDELNKRLAEANRIFLLNTWIPNLTSYIESIEKALSKNAEIQILLLYPYSNVAELRDQALRTSKNPLLDQNVKDGVERCMDTLRYIIEKTPEDKHKYLRVRFYNSLPSVSVYKTDDIMLVGVFFHGRLAVKSAQLEVHGENTLYGKQVIDELEKLWDIGKDIKDICNWRIELDLLAGEF